jgi:uncharacterized membrane protein
MLSILDLIGGAFDTLNFLDLVASAVAGWRYLLSPSYRARTNARWRHSTRLRIIADITGSVLCMAVSLFLLGLLVCYVFGLGWFRSAARLP